MIDSVIEQTYPNWELLCVNDSPGQTDLDAHLAAYADRDRRITVISRPRNGGIGQATRDGIEAATGEWIGLLDHDDLLELNALEEIAAVAVLDRTADVIYTDEFWVDDQNLNPHHFQKPDFSPERLRAQMYMGHMCFYRKTLLDQIGGMRLGFDGSQDYDLALRATEVARRVFHLRKPLYRWRIHGQSVSHIPGNTPVFDAAKRALVEHLERVGIVGTVEMVDGVGEYRIRRDVQGEPLVSVVIPTRGSYGVVRGEPRCMVVGAVRDIIERSSYTNVEVVVVYDTVTPTSVLDELRAIAGERLTLVEFEGDFNFSAKINRGAVHASGEFFLMLNDDVEVIDADWIEVLLSMAQVRGVGIAGSLLYFGNGTIQHAGHIYVGGAAGHSGLGLEADNPGFAGQLRVEREVSGITAACALVPRSVFFQVGGFSTTLPVNYNDVDFSLKVRQAGYRAVVSPFARLYHYESTTRVPFVSPYEMAAIHDRWARHMQLDLFN